jgi:hypothetical protein
VAALKIELMPADHLVESPPGAAYPGWQVFQHYDRRDFNAATANDKTNKLRLSPVAK